ncbi:MAG TPA: cupin domain-containing protein [Longimicrobiaceae bacterium]
MTRSVAQLSFDRCNLQDLSLEQRRAHHGQGEISFRRIVERGEVSGPCNFIDYAVVPPGASIGEHRHRSDEEEFYLILEGEGTMWRNGEEFRVRKGDLIRNPPNGLHRLENRADRPLRLFVFELAVIP